MVSTLLISLLACGDDTSATADTGTTPTDLDADADTDTDTDTDTDSDTDSDTDTDTDTDTWPSACPRYATWHAVGDWRTYETTDSFEAVAGYGGSYTSTVVAFERNGEDIRVETTGSYDISNFDYYRWTVDEVYRCDASGFGPVSFDSEVEYSTQGTEATVTSSTAWSNEPVNVPWDIQVGDTWTARFVGESTTSAGTTSIDFTSRYVAEQELSWTPPAGTFDALEVSYETDNDGVISEGAVYFNETIGWLDNLSFELADHGP